MGIYPAPFLRRLEKSVQHIVERVSPQYAQAYLANCDPTPKPVTAAVVAQNPSAQFLAAAPCDANGNPLPEKR
jgi:hypothetical protein